MYSWLSQVVSLRNLHSTLWLQELLHWKLKFAHDTFFSFLSFLFGFIYFYLYYLLYYMKFKEWIKNNFNHPGVWCCAGWLTSLHFCLVLFIYFYIYYNMKFKEWIKYNFSHPGVWCCAGWLTSLPETNQTCCCKYLLRSQILK